MIDYNPFSLEGKTILVTGASSGIGRATAIECSKMGATVVLTARNEERLKETLSMMEGKEHLIIPADLTEEEQIIELAKAVPQLDGVFCAAGKLNLKAIKFYSSKAVQEMFGANTFSAVYLVRDLLKKKKINDGASLVYMSSVASMLIPSTANGIYSACKAAIEAFSRQCAKELQHKMIRSNAIAPAMVDTPLLGEMILNGQDTKATEERFYLGKRFCKPKEVALMAVYLLSDASSFVTGTTMVIDGGRHLNYYE